MKRAQTITAFILLAVNIWMRFYAPINRTALILKHISLFLLLGIGAYAVTTAIFKIFYKRYNPTGVKETILHLGRVLSFSLIIILVGLFQIDYVEYSETPYTLGCKYYDEYNNLIYISKFEESCPDLVIKEQSNSTLKFSVYENYNTTHEEESIRVWNDEEYETGSYYMELQVDVNIEYEDGKILFGDYKETYNVHFTNEDKPGTIYTSYNMIVQNDFSNGYESIIKEAEISIENYNGYLNDLSHHTFEQNDYDEVRYYTTADIDVNNVMHLMKEYYNDNVLVTENVYSITKLQEESNTSYTLIQNILPDDYDFKTLDIIIRSNDITYSSNVEYSSTNTTNQVSFEMQEGFDNVFTNRKFTIRYNNDLSSNNVFDTEYFNTKEGMYITEDLQSGNGYYSNSSVYYLVTKEEYGKKVQYQYLRSLSYFGYLRYGEPSSTIIYFEAKAMFENIPVSNNIFNIEYQLEEEYPSSHIFYHVPYFIEEE